MKTPFPIAASIAQRPGYGGHACAFLQFAWGLARLGYEPIVIDRLEAGMVSGEEGAASGRVRDSSIRWFAEVMDAAGLGGSYCLLLDDGETLGLGREYVKEAAAAAPALINIMGFLRDEDLLEAAASRVFLDVDPGFPHLWRALELANPFEGHDRFVTVGANVGTSRCPIPTCGLDWIAIRPPVCLQRWPVAGGPPDPVFRTIGSWRGPYGPVDYEGRVLGLRVHEFRKFFDLPRRVEARFEVALDIEPADSRDREDLEAHGWRLLDPRAAAGSIEDYQRFIQASSAEIAIAKNIYVDTDSGWFSDRSACFLAAGRPVLAQETGFADLLPVGEGLVSFSSPEEAAAGAEQILGDISRHARAARGIAEEFFDSRKVIGGLLAELGAA